MSSLEAAEWLASERLDPDEADRADIRHALLMDMLVRLMAITGRVRPGTRLPSVADHLASLPWRSEHVPARPQTQAELRAKINMVMAALGGRKRGSR
jgi:hypothetical protein